MAQTLEELLVQINASTVELRKELVAGGADVQKFEKNVNREIAKVDKRFTALGRSLRASLGVLGLTLGGRELAQGISAFADRMREIDRQAEALGSTTDALQELQRTFREFRLDDDDVSDALGTIADRAQDAKDGMQSFIDDFKLLGVTVDEMRGKRPEELFALIADGAASIEDPTRRTAAIVRIFGDDLGRRLNPLLLEGSRGLEAYAQRWHETGLIIDRDGVAAGKEAAEMFAEMDRKVSALADNLMANLVPAINRVAENLNDLFFPDETLQIIGLNEDINRIQGQLMELDRRAATFGTSAEIDQRRLDLANALLDKARELDAIFAAQKERALQDGGEAGRAGADAGAAFSEAFNAALEQSLKIPESFSDLEGADRLIPKRTADQVFPIREIVDGAYAELEEGADQTAVEIDDRFDDLADSLGFTLRGGFSDAFRGIETDFDSLIQRMAADFLSSQLLDLLGAIGAGIPGPVGAFLAKVGGQPLDENVGQGPGRAAGGRVDPFHAFPVGEMGRTEMFVPDVPGRILNAAQLAGMSRGNGGMVVNQEFHITTSIPAELEATIRNVGGAAGRDQAMQVMQARRGRL